MLELIQAGGWVMLAIILCSIIALGIIIERFWSLRPSRVAPRHLLAQVWSWVKHNQLNKSNLKGLKDSSPLGEILAMGLINHHYGRETMKESIEETGRKVRTAGDYAHKSSGDVHMEHGGPEGALVLFNLYAPDGLLAESLARDGTVIGQSTLDQILKGRSSR